MPINHDTESVVVYKSLDFLGYPGYRVGTDGSVWSQRKSKPMGMGKGSKSILTGVWKRKKTTSYDKYGHQVVGFWKDGRQKTELVHRLVLKAFVGPCPEDMEACHNDSNPLNNNLSNLRWDTHKGNGKDMIGTQVNRGENHGYSKLTEDDVRSIRKRYALGERAVDLAKEFGVHRDYITSVANRRKGWQWLE